MDKLNPLGKKLRGRTVAQSLIEKRQDLISDVLRKLLVVIGVGALATGYFTGTGKPWLAFISGLVPGLAAFFLTKAREAELDNLLKGARGEIYIASELNLICSPRGMTVFNDLLCGDPVGKTLFNIDHIAVGPRGVFVFETKFREKVSTQKSPTIQFTSGDDHFVIGGWTDRVSINQTRGQARYLQRSIKEELGLDIRVYCATIFPGWFIDGYRISSPGVPALLNDTLIPAWLDKHEVVLSHAELHRVLGWLAKKNSQPAAGEAIA